MIVQFASGDEAFFLAPTTTKTSKVLGIARGMNPLSRVESIATDGSCVDVDIADFRIKKLENPSHPYQGTLP